MSIRIKTHGMDPKVRGFQINKRSKDNSDVLSYSDGRGGIIYHYEKEDFTRIGTIFSTRRLNGMQIINNSEV